MTLGELRVGELGYCHNGDEKEGEAANLPDAQFCELNTGTCSPAGCGAACLHVDALRFLLGRVGVSVSGVLLYVLGYRSV